MEAFDQPTVPLAQRVRAVRKELAGRRQDPSAAFQLLPPSLALVLPVRELEVPLPQGMQPLIQALGALGNQRANRWKPAARPTVQRPLAQTSQPSPQRRMRGGILAHRPDCAAQPWPLRVRIHVPATEVFDHRQGEALEREQFPGQDPKPCPASFTTGQGKPPVLRIESPAFAPHHDAALNPTAREDQGADRHALGAGNVCTDAFAFDSAGVQCIIRDGNRDRYRLGIGVSVSGGAGGFAPAPPHKKPIP